MVRGNSKEIFLSKMHPPKNITQCWIPPIKSTNWINVGNGYMSKNGSYPYFLPKYFI